MADIPELPGVRGKNFSDRDWYKGVSHGWEPYVSNVYTRYAQPQLNVVATAIPIKGDNREVLGILVLQIKLNTLLDWIKGIDIGPGGQVYVVDRKGMLAAHSTVPLQEKLVDFSTVPVVERTLRGERGIEVLFNPVDNEERVVAYEPITKYGWGHRRATQSQSVCGEGQSFKAHLYRIRFDCGPVYYLGVSNLPYLSPPKAEGSGPQG